MFHLCKKINFGQLGIILIISFELFSLSRSFANDHVSMDYMVPVKAELREFANFTIDDYEIQKRDTQVRIRYTLPLELTGERIEVEFSGSMARSNFVAEGPQGSIACVGERCIAEYRNLDINPDKVREYLQSKISDPKTLQGKLSVAEIFMGEPIGVISPKKPY